MSALEANPNNIRSLEDVIAWNRKYSNREGGVPGVHPAWPSGQDNFEMALELKGEQNEAYFAALKFIRQKSREEGIDAALGFQEDMLDGLLVPIHADGGIACQVAAKAGMCDSTIHYVQRQ